MMFHHLSLNCNDMLAIERFYGRHFGFQRARVIDLPDGRQIVFLKGGGVYLELFPAQGERPASPDTNNEGLLYPGVRNFSFEVDDVDAQLAAMGGRGADHLRPLEFRRLRSRLAQRVAGRPRGQHLSGDPGLYRSGQPASAAGLTRFPARASQRSDYREYSSWH